MLQTKLPQICHNPPSTGKSFLLKLQNTDYYNKTYSRKQFRCLINPAEQNVHTVQKHTLHTILSQTKIIVYNTTTTTAIKSNFYQPTLESFSRMHFLCNCIQLTRIMRQSISLLILKRKEKKIHYTKYE